MNPGTLIAFTFNIEKQKKGLLVACCFLVHSNLWNTFVERNMLNYGFTVIGL